MTLANRQPCVTPCPIQMAVRVDPSTWHMNGTFVRIKGVRAACVVASRRRRFSDPESQDSSDRRNQSGASNNGRGRYRYIAYPRYSIYSGVPGIVYKGGCSRRNGKVNCNGRDFLCGTGRCDSKPPLNLVMEAKMLQAQTKKKSSAKPPLRARTYTRMRLQFFHTCTQRIKHSLLRYTRYYSVHG